MSKATGNIIRLIVSLIAVCASWPGFQAYAESIDRLADQADAVVVGEIQSGQQTGHSLAFVLSVTRAIKGDLSPGATINVSGTTRVSLTRGLRGQYGLWFLKNTNAGWEVMPVITGGAMLESSGFIAMPKASSPATVNTVSRASTINDQTAVELAAAVQSYTDPKQLFNLAFGLTTVGQNAIVADLYRSLRTNADPEIKFIGLTGLLGSPDEVSALAEIASSMDSIPRLHTRSLLVAALCGDRDPDPSAVRSLGKIASSSDPNIQRCSAMALDFIHTRDTLPFLAQLLNSADVRTREYAMQGLSRFVDNLPIQTAYNVTNGKALVAAGPTPYRTPETDQYSLSRRWLGQADETGYLQFWRSWWAAMKDKLTAQAP